MGSYVTDQQKEKLWKITVVAILVHCLWTFSLYPPKMTNSKESHIYVDFYFKFVWNIFLNTESWWWKPTDFCQFNTGWPYFETKHLATQPEIKISILTGN